MRVRRCRDRRRGSSMVEFALVFLPMFGLLCGVFELGRAMWTYHSVSSAVKKAARYTVVRGSSCSSESSSGCTSSVAEVAEEIRQASLGLEERYFRVTLEAGSQTVFCETLSSCLSSSVYWPAPPNNAVGRPIAIKGEYAFHTFLFSFWPGARQTGVTFRSESSEVIQF